jgi:hypothetical protein
MQPTVASGACLSSPHGIAAWAAPERAAELRFYEKERPAG